MRISQKVWKIDREQCLALFPKLSFAEFSKNEEFADCNYV